MSPATAFGLSEKDTGPNLYYQSTITHTALEYPGVHSGNKWKNYDSLFPYIIVRQELKAHIYVRDDVPYIYHTRDVPNKLHRWTG